jgi:hypothetical protein
MAHAPLPLLHRGFGETKRRDAWWLQPLVVFLILGGFVVYATWAAFQNAHYTYGPYLSPFYSPEIYGDPRTAWFGAKPGWWPALLPFSPALIILPFPGLFRFTCYYYRGAYYKAFWADPPNCAVGEPRKSYIGERSFPLILQNIHRYFMYIAGAVSFFPVARRLEGALVRRRRGKAFRNRTRHDRAGRERRAPQLLHARLPLDAACRWRISLPVVTAPDS